jgi:conjugative relaxase-like TrwC/TraI family protein
MLSIAKIAPSGSNYLARDNYYAKGEEDAGQWFGKGAEKLGFTGGVDNEQFDEMVKGKFGDITLGRKTKDGIEHHPGWDHTFSAPKSVSLLALVGGDSRLIEAHDTAVDYTLQNIENKFAESRVRVGGVGGFIDNQKTGNIVCAKFRHDISRAKDPQLHTHAAILNATIDINGNLRSLDSPALYEHKMLNGAIYQSKLAELVQEIGYQTKIRSDGTFEIIGVNKELVDDASKRRNEIKKDMYEKGISGAIASQYSSLATRPHKEDLSHDEKKYLWNEDFKNNLQDLKSLIDFSKQQTNTHQHRLSVNQQKEAEKAVNSAIKHLSETESVFKAIDIKREALVASLGKTDDLVIDDAILDKYLSGDLLQSSIKEIKMSGGNTVIVEKEAYTTPELLAKEKQTIKIMKEGRFKVESIIDNNTKLKREDVFTQGQKDAAKAILTTEDRFISIQGYAGTGKTFMLQEVKEQAEKHNYKIKGFAPSGAAANVLQKETDIESQTIQKFLKQGLRDLNNRQNNKFADDKENSEIKQQELWVVDEASFVSTTQANAFVKIATRENAQVVLIGDKQQLTSVEAGKPFAVAQDPKHLLQTVKMNEIIRQKDEELKQAVYSATKGDIKTAFAKIDKNIIEVQDKQGNDDPIKRRELIAQDYLKLNKKERDNTLVISPANEDRGNINNKIRDGLIAENTLTSESALETINLISKNLTIEAKTKSYNYHKNDIVRFNRSYKTLSIKENDYLKVANVNNDNNVITLISENNKQIEWNPKKIASKGVELYFTEKRELRVGEELFWRRSGGDKNKSRRTNERIKILSINDSNIGYVDKSTGVASSMDVGSFVNKHWEYAYCLTAHQSQGQTADNVIINLESWRSKLSNQQAFYVEISRAKNNAIIYTDNKEQIQRQLTTNTGEKHSALEQIFDPRMLNIDKQLEALNNQENDEKYTLEQVARSINLKQEASVLVMKNEADNAADIILGNKDPDGDWVLHFGNTKKEFWQNEIDKNHQKLETIVGKDGYKQIIDTFREQGKINETSQTIAVQKDSEKAIGFKEIITNETPLSGTEKEKQQTINNAHKELKSMVGEDNYKELMTNLNKDYDLNIPTIKSQEQMEISR